MKTSIKLILSVSGSFPLLLSTELTSQEPTGKPVPLQNHAVDEAWAALARVLVGTWKSEIREADTGRKKETDYTLAAEEIKPNAILVKTFTGTTCLSVSFWEFDSQERIIRRIVVSSNNSTSEQPYRGTQVFLGKINPGGLEIEWSIIGLNGERMAAPQHDRWRFTEGNALEIYRDALPNSGEQRGQRARYVKK